VFDYILLQILSPPPLGGFSLTEMKSSSFHTLFLLVVPNFQWPENSFLVEFSHTLFLWLFFLRHSTASFPIFSPVSFEFLYFDAIKWNCWQSQLHDFGRKVGPCPRTYARVFLFPFPVSRDGFSHPVFGSVKAAHDQLCLIFLQGVTVSYTRHSPALPMIEDL